MHNRETMKTLNMKTVVWTLGLLLLTGGLAAAQDVNEPESANAPGRSAMAEFSAIDKALIANERKISDAIMKKDKTAFAALVAADGWMVDGSGAMKTSALTAAFDQLVIKNYTISDEKVSWVDPNTAILTYKWLGTGTYGGQPMPGTVYASTVWTKKADKWVAVFHQESAATK
jgi:hypothetical protein